MMYCNKYKYESRVDENQTQEEELSLLSKGLAHPHRIEILKILIQLPSDQKCIVDTIVEQLPISQSTVSQHLRVLKEAGWIKGEIDGPRICYCINEENFTRYRQLLNNLLINRESGHIGMF